MLKVETRKVISSGFRAAFFGAVAAFPVQALGADTIRIGVSGPFTGGSAPMGVSMRDGIQLAVEEINARGGILGRPVQLIVRDDEGKSELGIQVAQELIEKERVAATVGYVNTGVALASQRFYQEAGIPVMSCAATGTAVTRQFMPPEYDRNFVFRTGLYDSAQAEVIAAEAIDRRKLTKIAILADSTNFGQLGRADVEAALKKRSITPVASEKFNLKDVDMTAQILRARKAGAELLVTYGIGPELAQIVNGLAKLGWTVPVIGPNPMGMSSFVEIAGPNAEGRRFIQSFIQEPTNPRRKAFIDAYTAKYKVARIPNPPSAAQCYDSVYLLAAAIEQAKSTDGDRIRKALESLDRPVDGVVMTYVRPFSADNHEGFDPRYAVVAEYRDGVIRFAYDADRR